MSKREETLCYLITKKSGNDYEMKRNLKTITGLSGKYGFGSAGVLKSILKLYD